MYKVLATIVNTSLLSVWRSSCLRRLRSPHVVSLSPGLVHFVCAIRVVLVIGSVKHPNTWASVVGWTWSQTVYSNYVDEETARAPTLDHLPLRQPQF